MSRSNRSIGLRCRSSVIAGLDPAIHQIRKMPLAKRWTRGSSPRVTPESGQHGSIWSERALVLGVAPDAVPVGAARVGDAAVLLEELVRHLEHGEHQPALGTPGDVAAARLAPHVFARADLEPGRRAFLIH